MKTRLVVLAVVAALTLLAVLTTLTTVYLLDDPGSDRSNENSLIVVEPASSEIDPSPRTKHWTLAASPERLHLLENDMEYSFSTSDQIGGHLGHISLHCESEKLSKLKTALGDVDQPLDTKMVALAVSSIAVGCKETAIFICRLVVDRTFTNISSGINGPYENASYPCDLRETETIRAIFKASDRLSALYDVLSSSLFLTLGCKDLGLDALNYLEHDFNITHVLNYSSHRHNVDDNNNNNNTSHFSKTKKGILIMNYVNGHKVDGSISPLVDGWSGSMKRTNTSSEYTGLEIRRSKRNVENDGIDQFFKVKLKCSIELPLGATLYSLTKLECLKLCLDEDSCQSAGYRNDDSQECHLNVETEKEVGTFFTCDEGESANWDYFEKVRDINYFVISNKLRGTVLQAKSQSSVDMGSYDGTDNELWYWKGDSIFSKSTGKVLHLVYGKYTRKIWGRTYTFRYSVVQLSTSKDSASQNWNYYENGSLTSQHKNLRLTIKSRSNEVAAYRDNGAIYQRWTLSLGVFYFIITNRQSGKVLDASLSGVLNGKAQMWSYHGNDNQLWFWDDDCIRSKKFPDKVLDLSTVDYQTSKWGRVRLSTYNGGDNQRWKFEGDRLISVYNNLILDVYRENTVDGTAVGGYRRTGGTSQMWSVGNLRTYLFILNKNSGKVIDATSASAIEQWPYNKGDSQLWFWDGDVIRNKKYPYRVIDLDTSAYISKRWRRIRLRWFTGSKNQRWKSIDHYIVSEYKSISIEVKDRSHADGYKIGARKEKTQKWSFNQEHDYFTITSRQDAKVLDASPSGASSGKVHMWSYHGEDNQLWFWDDNSIRSKKYPSKVLDIDINDYKHNQWGKLHLNAFNGGDNQRWKVEGDSLVSLYEDLRLEIKWASKNKGAEVGGYKKNKKLNQRWSFNSKERIMFTIRGVSSDKALNAYSRSTVGLSSFHEDDNQLWFWDKDSIRSKEHPDKVLDLDMAEYNKNGWGRINMRTYNGGRNQVWTISGESIISGFQQLRMDVYHSSKSDGAKVGGNQGNGKDNQKWTIAAQTDPGCVDETEQDIYEFVQWIPVFGTLWDLGSSIGYAAAGCHDVAQERAISFAIGFVMDVATVVTGGAAAGVRFAVQAGIKAGLKLGVKQGLKVTIHVTKNSMKRFFETAATNIAKNGVRKTLITEVKGIVKLVARETIVDPALFLKNFGKMSKTILVHPKRTVKQTWEAASKNVENLKSLKTEFKDHITPPNRCTRTLETVCSVLIPKLNKERQVLEQTFDSLTISKRYNHMPHVFNPPDGYLPAEMDSAIMGKVNTMLQNENGVNAMELFAVYKYTMRGEPNIYTRSLLERRALPDNILKLQKDALEEHVREKIYQAALIQDYIKKHPLEKPDIKVFRYEGTDTSHLYKEGQEFMSTQFMSSTRRNERLVEGLGMTDEAHPVEIVINLKKSGSDISSISHYPKQEEVLIPMFTFFKVERAVNVMDRDGIIRKTKVVLTEIPDPNLKATISDRCKKLKQFTDENWCKTLLEELAQDRTKK